jgi:hypothetical protein
MEKYAPTEEQSQDSEIANAPGPAFRRAAPLPLNTAAQSYARGGLSLFPVNSKTKKPFGEWTRHQTELDPPEQVSRWAKDAQAFAVACGAVSGGSPGYGLCALDFDVPASGEPLRFFEAWRAAVGELADGLPMQQTGSGGLQVLFRCPEPGGNQKLAFTPNPDEDTGREIVIETRGAGGYAVLAPSLHPNGKNYTLICGDFANIPQISQARADALLEAARKFNEAPYTKQQLEAQAKREQAASENTRSRAALNGQGSAIDAFNAARTIEEELERASYTRKGERYVRPGGHDQSVTVRDNRSFHHASNDALNDGYWHTPFDVRCYYSHEGKAKDAVKAVAQELGLPPLRKTPRAKVGGRKSDAPGGYEQGTNQSEDEMDNRPVINADEADAANFAPQCWEALQQANSEAPHLFRMGATLMRLECEDDSPSLREVKPEHLIYELARAALFTRIRKKGRGENTEEIETVVHPPKEYARDLLAEPAPPLPALRRIVAAPVFASNGELQTEPGYHPHSRTYYHPAHGLNIPAIPEKPSAEDVKQARGIIQKTICDFPFVTQADRTNALAFAFTPFARDLIETATPLGDVEATSPGTGKGLLVDALLIPSIGRNTAVMTQWGDEEECRKRITAVLKTGKAAVLLDNVTKPLNSGTFAGALTALDWEDRMMATHETRSFPVRCVWLMTANNPVMSTEIARRCVRIRLDAKCERAWQRTGFSVPDLRGWIHLNRGQIIGAYLTLIRAWLCAGRPEGKTRLGSYEEWSSVIGGILGFIGEEGFLGNLQEFYDTSDTEGAAWRELVGLWFDKHHDQEVTAGELFQLAQGVEDLPIPGKTERGQKTAFGVALLHKRDTVIGGFQIIECDRDRKNARLWKLKPVEKPITNSA